MKKIYFIISVFLFINFTTASLSQSKYNLLTLKEKFDEANNLYNDSKYNKSIEIYNLILESGYESSELYFNLGNSYYKLNDLANSILFYEKSLKLNSTDSDVINNLKIANNSLIDDIAIVQQSFFNELLNNISNSLRYSSWGTLLIFLSFLFLLLFLIYFFSNIPYVKRTTFTSMFLLIIIIVIVIKISLISYEKVYLQKYAIVFSTKIEIKSDPNEKSENLFNLHLGTKVEVIENFNDKWAKIKLVNGQEGWIKINEIKII
tara:strand:- start:759 stop:1544 length:786 start_codon:yes stop_codon:yes gene_type:complete